MDQGGVILKNARNTEAATAFRTFLLSAQARTIFREFGFYLPEESR
jgi:ABC-type molybdate transport system substrate-binding protein